MELTVIAWPPLTGQVAPRRSAEELEDAEDDAALADWKARDAAGQTSYVPHDELRRRLGL